MSIRDRIISAKAKLGRRLVILGHHYQREEVIEFADFRGDSFGLSKIASEQKEAEFIVFCGVHFMAEAAKILARPRQRVFLPDVSAGCPMAEMAPIEKVEAAWSDLKGERVVPVTYMNSTAELKSFCGERGGIVCTSSNAADAFKWALENGDRIFFFPDEHLGKNTARKLGIKTDRILIWPGFCHVHTHFSVAHVERARAEYPGCKVIVHPECFSEVVMASDESASTEGICKYVLSQPKGSTIVVGTEINLVARLAKENPDREVVPLDRSLCPNMFKISPQKLCTVLEGIVEGKPVNEITVPEDVADGARKALNRMLQL